MYTVITRGTVSKHPRKKSSEHVYRGYGSLGRTGTKTERCFDGRGILCGGLKRKRWNQSRKSRFVHNWSTCRWILCKRLFRIVRYSDDENQTFTRLYTCVWCACARERSSTHTRRYYNITFWINGRGQHRLEKGSRDGDVPYSGGESASRVRFV